MNINGYASKTNHLSFITGLCIICTHIQPLELDILRNFQPLENILNMDFQALRQLDTESGKAATDEALRELLDNFNAFFAQFKGTKPTALELQTYKEYLTKITEQMSASEYAYYLKRYQAEGHECAEQMAKPNRLKSYHDIPKRMQFWSAPERWGEMIRFANDHKNVVKNLKRWSDFIEQPHYFAFFTNDNGNPPTKAMKLTSIDNTTMSGP